MFYASELENKTTFKFKALLVQKLHVGSRLINSLLAANRKKNLFRNRQRNGYCLLAADRETAYLPAGRETAH